jgi:RNA polymerase sigma factor (sigma-70 family)
MPSRDQLLSSYIPLSVLRTQSDARLVDLARGGHERAFEALVRRYRKPLLGYCRRMLLPEARAEDALQQGLLQAWLALREGGEVRDAKAWLYRIVHNAAISARRRSGYDYVQLDESLHGTGASASDIDRRIAVREALAGLAALPEAQREVLLRTAIHGHSHEQVATDLGLSDGAVRGLIYRARATLRAAATACTPPQVVLWAARAAESGSAHPQLTEIAGGAGSAGLLGALLKGGAVVASIGVLATGTGLVEHTARPGARVHLHGALAANGGAQAPRSFGAASAHLTAAASPTVTTAPRGAGSHVSRHHIAGRRSARAGTEIVPQRDGLGRDRRPATGAANSASQDGSGGAGGVRGGGARRELQRPSYDGTPGKGGDRGSEPSPRTSGSGGGGMDSRGGGSQTLSTALSAAAESRDARPRSGTGDAHAGDTSAAAPESTRGSGSPAESGSDH